MDREGNCSKRATWGWERAGSSKDEWEGTVREAGGKPGVRGALEAR